MPFVKRVVYPVFLSRKPLDKGIVREEAEAVNNNTLVEVLRQLACLTRLAEDVFQDLAVQANQLHCRTEKLKGRICRLDETVQGLDAKAVIVPVGDLDKFSRVRQHFVSQQHHDHGLFHGATRPPFLATLYESAVMSPVHIIRQIDRHRADGHRSSKIFMCLPFFKETTVGLDIETRRPASMSSAPTWLHQEEEEDETKKDVLRRLPSPEEVTYAMSLKFQYSDVPIDVTGTGFWRMASFRRSLIQHVEYLTKRKKKKGKRRNSVSADDYDKEAQQAAKITNLRLKSGTQTCRARLQGPKTTSTENKEVQTCRLGPKDSWLNNRARFRASICGGNIYEEVDKLRRVRQLEDSEDEERGALGNRAKSDLAVAVKMRDSSARSSGPKGSGDDGGQSSSGNWSASSSTRASLESDHARSPELLLPRTGSQTSVSKDSALSESNTPVEDPRLNYINSSIKKNSLPNGKIGKDTAKWLRSLQEETTDTSSTTGTITPHLGHPRPFSPFDMPIIDDGESSEFSVDNDGYYTSMHTDSGLRPLPISQAPVVLRKSRGPSGSNSTLSSVGVDSGSARSSYSGGTVPAKKRTPPPPPPRTSTLSASNSPEGPAEFGKGERARVSRKASFSDSDQDYGGEKLLGKTAIDAKRIPSMCVVTPSPSDDEAGSSRSTSTSTGGGSSTDGSDMDRRPYSTLPRNFSAAQPQGPSPLSMERATSFNEKNNTNSWPRRPNSVLYRPDTIVLYQGNTGKMPHQDKGHMRTFFQPERPKPLTIDVAERLSPAPLLPTPPTASSNRGGARVVLDPMGHVIHCSSGSIAKPSSGGSSPTGSASPTFPAPMSPMIPSVPYQMQGTPRYLGYLGPGGNSDGSLRLHQYDTNTLPRRRYSTTKTEPVFPDHSDTGQPGTIPRRRANFSFLRKEPVLPNKPVQPQLSVSAKTGAYVRLDGHPNHLVPNGQPAPETPPPQPTSPFKENLPSRTPTKGQSPTAMLASQALNAARIPVLSPNHNPNQSALNKSPVVQQPASFRYKMGSPPRGPLASSFLQSTSSLIRPVAKTYSASPTVLASVPSNRGNITSEVKRTVQPVKVTETPTKKTMTTEDLFAAIHHSKRKFDIKSDPECPVSSPPSSRSVSPATSTPTKSSWWGTTPRNGFLSPRSPPDPIAGDRRSWSCERSSPSPCTTPRATTPTLSNLSPGDRKSWASDRLGPTKQTSLRDFKMLLLQAGRGTPTKAESTKRPSASEMLKASAPTAARRAESPSPTTPPALSNGYNGQYNGHYGPSTRQGHMGRHGRCRTPLSSIHNTSEILSSTIPEDCSEDSDGSSSMEPLASSPLPSFEVPSRPNNPVNRFRAVSVLQGLRSSRLPTSTAV